MDITLRQLQITHKQLVFVFTFEDPKTLSETGTLGIEAFNTFDSDTASLEFLTPKVVTYRDSLVVNSIPWNVANILLSTIQDRANLGEDFYDKQRLLDYFEYLANGGTVDYFSTSWEA